MILTYVLVRNRVNLESALSPYAAPSSPFVCRSSPLLTIMANRFWIFRLEYREYAASIMRIEVDMRSRYWWTWTWTILWWKGSLWINVKVNGRVRASADGLATQLCCCTYCVVVVKRWWTEGGGTLKYIITYNIKWVQDKFKKWRSWDSNPG